jgi:hypothetical protein
MKMKAEMDRDFVDSFLERELRRRHLARRLIRHHARTQTMEDLTGLTRHRLATLRRRAGVSPESRFRGPAPTSFEIFFSCARARNESAVLAFLYCALGASTLGTRDGDVDAALSRGERLCDVYELWQRLLPSSTMEFEQLTLLGEGITRKGQIALGHCDHCRALLLVDVLSTRRRRCGHCSRPRRKSASQAQEPTAEDEETNLTLYALQLLGGQLLR